MEDWALIRRLAADGVAKAEIARKLGISRTTVLKAIASERPPKYERSPRSTSFTPFEVRVRALLDETPEMPATVLAERVGWSGSIRWFRDNVNRVRVDHRPIDPADRLSWSAGDAAHAICGSRPARSSSKTGPARCCRCWCSRARSRGSCSR